MDWRKTLIIFAMVFLFLDIYLAFLWYTKQQENELDALSQTTFEETLKQQEISIDQVNFKTHPTTAPYLSARYHKFEISDLKKLTKQNYKIENNGLMVVSDLKDKIAVEGPDFTALKNYVANNIYKGASYTMASYDEETTEIIFKQKYENRRFVEGDEAKLVFYCEDGFVKSYTQTLLTDISKLSGTNELISPSQGFESLFQNNKIPSKATVVDVQLGYYILGKLESSNVYMPVWYYTIELDDQRMQLMVDAIEGQVLTTEMSQNVEYTAKVVGG